MRARNNSQGFVSLFTTIMLSLLLLVITVSLVSLEALQLRKAEDAEQSLRAYYAAEAGVEDAVSKVLSKSITGLQTCVDPTAQKTDYDIPGQAGWTCQQVSFSGSPEGRLERPDQAKTIDPSGVNFGSMFIEFNQDSAAAACYYSFGCATHNWTANTFPSQAQYDTASATAAPYGMAAPIEFAIVDYPKGGFVATDPNLKLQNMLVLPGGAAVTGVISYKPASGFPAAGPYRAKCSSTLPWTYTSGGASIDSKYHCVALLTDMNFAGGGNDFLFRLRSRYSATGYKLTFKEGSGGNGNTVQVPDGTATIDVTAKAGQTYRRVISKLPLNAGAAAGLNYVMYSDTNICKNFNIINNVYDPVAGSGCGY